MELVGRRVWVQRKRLEMGGEKDWWAGASTHAQTSEKLEMGGEKDRWAGASVDARTCADGVGATERLEMGGEKARWAGASVDARTCADGLGARERLEMCGEKDRWAGASVDARTSGVGALGARERSEMGRRTGAQERAWMRGRVRTVWVQEKGWKLGGEKDRWAGASVDARTCEDGVGGLEKCAENDRWAVDART